MTTGTLTPDLFDDYLARLTGAPDEDGEPIPRDLPIHERWCRWERRNRAFYPIFRHFAFQLIGAGRAKIGAKAIVERVRWEVSVRTEGDPWKINNDYPAYYARLFMAEHPEHDGIFETRCVGVEQPPEFYRLVLTERP